MKSEILILNSIKDGAGLSLSASSIALVKIKELEASSLTNKTTLINSITSALTSIQTKDADNQIDYSDQNAAEIVAFNNAIGAASTALEGNKNTSITTLQASHSVLDGKVTTAESKITGLESFKTAQESTNESNTQAVAGLTSEIQLVKKKALENAIEYHSGNCIPTKTSEPASLWGTLDKCLEHEGDIYTIKVDSSSPESAQGKDNFQYRFLRTIKGIPNSTSQFDWVEIGAGQFSQLSASLATLDHKVTENNSDTNFQNKITANKDKIVAEVKAPIAAQAKQEIVSDNSFVSSVTPKIDTATGKWKNADGTVSENYAVADKVPAFTSAVSGANTAAGNANAAAGAANTAKTAADNAANAANAAKTAADTAASNATSAASGANQAKYEILQAKNNGEFSAVRLYVEQTGSFKNGKVIDGVSGKVVLTPKYFVGGVEKTIVGSGKVVKWYKFVANGTDMLKKTVTASGSTDVRLLLSDGEMGTYYFDINI